MVKLSEIIDVKDIDTVVNLHDVIGDKTKTNILVKNYIVTDEVQNLFNKILSSISRKYSPEYEKKSGKFDQLMQRFHLITASMGKGKSFFLLMLNTLLKTNSSASENISIKLAKTNKELDFQIKSLKDKKYLQIFVIGTEYANQTIDEIITQQIKNELIKEGIESIAYIKANYSEAIKIIDNISKIISDSFEKHLEKISGKKYTLIKELRSDLEMENKDALQIFIKCFNSVLGAPPELKTPNFKENMLNLVEGVKKEGYNGIIIYFDEMTTYFLSSQELGNVNYNISNLQVLAEMKRNDLFFIGSLHENIENTIKDKQARRNFEKLAGRFQNHDDLIEFSFDQIITSILTVNESNLEYHIYQESKGKYAEYFRKIGNLSKDYKFKYKWKRFYPFHPSTIYFLKIISEFSQANRTAIHFVKNELKKNLDNNLLTNKKIFFLTPDSLWDFFEKGISKERNEFVTAVKTILEDKKENQKQIIKTMGVIAASISTTLRTTSDFVSITPDQMSSIYFESPDDLYNELMYIHDNSNGIYCESNNIDKLKSKFRIEILGYKNVEGLIKDFIEKINPQKTFHDLIKNKIDNDYFPKTISHLGVEWRGINFYQSSFSKSYKIPNYGDINAGLMLLLPDIEKNNLKDLEEYAISSQKKLPNNIGLVFIKKINFDIRSLNRYSAILRAIGSTKVSKDDRDKLDQEKSKIENTFNRTLTEILEVENIDIILRNNIIQGELRARDFDDMFGKYDLSSLFKDGLKAILSSKYPKFPPIDDENPIKSRTTTNDIINKLIVQKEQTDSTLSGQAKNQVRSNLIRLGLVKKRNNIYTIQEPDPNLSPIMADIFGLINNKSAEDGTDLHVIYSLLRKEPYGLQDHIIELFLMFYITNILGYIEETTSKTRLNKKNYKSLLPEMSDNNGTGFKIFKTKEIPNIQTSYINSTLENIFDSEVSYQKITNENADDCAKVIVEYIEKVIESVEESMIYIIKINNFLKKLGNDSDTEQIEATNEAIQLINQELLLKYKKEEITGSEFIDLYYKFPSNYLLKGTKSQTISQKQSYDAFENIMETLKKFSKENDILKNILNWLVKSDLNIADLEKIDKIKASEFNKDLNNLINSLSQSILEGAEILDIFYRESIRENWLKYYDYYKELHSEYNNIAKKFLTGIKDTKEHKLIKKLSDLKIPNILDINSVNSKIEKYRLICTNKKLNNVKNIEDVKCTSCKRDICELSYYIRDHEEISKTILSEMKSIIKNRLEYVQDNLAEFNTYVFNNVTPNLDSNLIKEFRKFLSTQNFKKLNELSDETLHAFIDYIDKIKVHFNTFISNIESKKPDAKRESLTIETFYTELKSKYQLKISSKGVKTLTMKEMARLLRSVIEEMEKEFAEYYCELMEG